MPVVERPKIFVNKVHLKGFKSIEDLTIDFQEGLNVLIGKNGSGKSNFMESVFRLLMSRSKVFYNYARIEFTSSDNHIFAIELQKVSQNASLDGANIEDRIGLNEKFSIDDKIYFDSSNTEHYPSNFIFENKKISYASANGLRNLFMRLGYLAIYPLYIGFALPDFFALECLSLPGTLKINLENEFSTWEYPDTISSIQNVLSNIELVYDGSLAHIKTINKSNFYKRLEFSDEIRENLKRYSNIQEVRFNNNLNVYNDGKSIIIENIKVDFKVNGSWLPWSQLSDGTQRLFYIIAETTNSNGLILIEEPELGVHPHQFSLLMDFLKEQSENKQILMSTHSPKALDHLPPDDLNSILITSYNKADGTQIRHLTTQEITKAKRYMKEVGFFSDYWMLSDLE